MRLLPFALLLACADPRPLPAEASARQTDALRAEAPPALARALYEAPVGPAPLAREQRVRLLVWLDRMALDRGQLERLDALRVSALAQVERVRAAEQELSARRQAQTGPIYDEIWAALAAGEDPDGPRLRAAAEALDAAGGGPELLRLRLEGVRLILESERAFLETLSEAQQARLAEGLFALRRRLDPLGAPGDWEALVGSGFEPGAAALLLRGSSAGLEDPQDLGALWGASSDPGERALPEARREAILFLLLLEPGLDEAIAAARALTGSG